MVPAKNKYADSKSSAYLRGTWLKTKKYQAVILAYLRYVSTRITHPGLYEIKQPGLDTLRSFSFKQKLPIYQFQIEEIAK